MTDVKQKNQKSPKIPDMTALALKSPAKPVEDLEHLMATPDKATMKKINALKNVQLQMLDVESKFYDELHELECKYAKLYEPFYEKRKKIVTGEYEPTETEGKWTLDELEDEEDQKAPIENGEPKKDAESEKGIKNFWLETLQSFRITSETIQEYDEPILAYLEDITCRLFETKPYGYVLEFHFAENPYFTNKMLTKTYELKTEVDPKDPFSFDGPDLEKAIGCKIDWKPNKNVTVKLIKKKLKSRNKKLPPKIVTKEEIQDSFFNFFDTPGSKPKLSSKSPASSSAEDNGKHANSKQLALKHKNDEDDDEGGEGEDDDELYLIADFEIGQYLKEKVIPKAILYYTGEGIDDEFDDYDEDEEDDEDGEQDDENDDDEDDDDEEDDDEEDNGKKGGKGKKALLGPQAKGKNGKGMPKAGEPTPSECKQN